MRIRQRLRVARHRVGRRLQRVSPRGISWRPLVVFTLSLALLEVVEAHFRQYAAGGLYFQGWSSETMMQSVSLRELRAAPLQSLWYLHIQPPITNLLRALIVAFHRELDWSQVMRAVDRDLHHAWVVTAAAMAALIDAWLRRLRVSGLVAAILTLGWLLHPANLAYVTLLDGTLLSSLLTTWILYEIWNLTGAAGGSLTRLALAVLFAYFTRSLYQWPFVMVMLASLALLGVSARRMLQWGLVVGLIIGLYSFKQECLFGTVGTSTFQGTNLTHSIGADCASAPPVPGPRPRSTAAVLTEPRKLDGTPNFNHVDRLAIERGLLACFRRQLAQRSLASLVDSYEQNLELYLQPSSRYAGNALVDRLPWRDPVDWVCSGWRLASMVMVGGALAIWQRRRRRARVALAMLLPVMYVIGISVIGERPENMRFKFFLEPSLLVLVGAQFCGAASRLVSAVKVRRLAPEGVFPKAR